MRLVCPGCGFTAGMEAYLLDASAREAVLLALKLPAPLGDRVLRYVGLFRPAGRALTWDRVERLLGELLPPIAEAKVERHGRTWPAPLDYWSMALDEMLGRRDTLVLPLKSHGYLFEIVAGYANKGEAAAERKTEQLKAHPASRVHVAGGGLQKVGPTDEFRALVAQMKRGKPAPTEEAGHADPAD